MRAGRQQPLHSREGRDPVRCARFVHFRQRLCDPFGPCVDRWPVAVVAEAPAESVEEHARPQRPLLFLDDSLEDAVLARLEVGTNLSDFSGLFVSERADQGLRVAERPDAEKP